MKKILIQCYVHTISNWRLSSNGLATAKRKGITKSDDILETLIFEDRRVFEMISMKSLFILQMDADVVFE